MLYTGGLIMKGIKKASGETRDCYFGGHTEIFYDTSTGDVWAKFQPSPNNWTEYPEGIVRVLDAVRKTSMQTIANSIIRAMRKE